MAVSVLQQWQFFLWSVLAGALLAAVYDLLRLSRRMVHTKDIVVNIEDILFCALAAVVVFAAAFLKNEGKLRWQGFFGAGAGFLVYRFLVRDFLVNSAEFLLRWLIKILFFLLRIILFPVAVVFRLLRRPFRLITWYSRRGGSRIRTAVRVRKKQAFQHWKNTRNAITKK